MTRKSPHFRRARIVVATSAVALLAFAACEMTPRGGTPSPTEPTLADVVEPGRPEVSQRFVVEFSDSVTGPAEGTLLSPTGEVTIFRINETGDSTITGTLRLRESPLQDLEGEGAKPLYIVDGERVASLEGLDPARVLHVDVLKGPLAVQRFGGEGQDGVVQITTGDPGEGSMRRVRRIETAVAGGTHSAAAIEDVTALRLSPVAAGMEPLETRFFDPENPGARPLFFVDGEKVSSIEGLDPARIEKIEVLKGAAAAEYGPEGKDGVILVTTRR